MLMLRVLVHCRQRGFVESEKWDGDMGDLGYKGLKPMPILNEYIVKALIVKNR